MAKKIFFWITDTDTILRGEKPPVAIGGANVQLAFWAKKFAEKGWRSYAFTYHLGRTRKTLYGISYVYTPLIRKLMAIFYDFRFIWLYILKPDIVCTRVAARDLLKLTQLSRKLGFKIVHMLASDDDVQVNGEPTRLQKGLVQADFVVAQNADQKSNFRGNFHNWDIPVIPNIWDGTVTHNTADVQGYDVVWVGNFRDVKRPEWLVDMARDLPEYRFAMIGSTLDATLYKTCREKAAGLTNIEFAGFKSLFEVTQIISRSRVLVCTSTMEGFPNTFLQAWSTGTPIVSTVDPNGVLSKHGVGFFSAEYEGLLNATRRLLTDNEYNRSVRNKIEDYFLKTHDPEKNYQVFVNYLETGNKAG